jgi:hypothetical protein
MDKKTQRIIDKCHKLMEKGCGPGYCLERFRDFDKEIRDYFSIAKDIGRLGKKEPSKGFTNRSLDSIISRAESEEASEAIAPLPVSPGRLILRPAIIFIAFIVISVFSFTGALFASQESIPGETLYPLKRSFEQFQLNIYPESMKGGLHLRFLGNRIEEAEILLAAENGADLLLIEELISDVDRHYQSCSQYDCIGPGYEDDILDSINSIKNRYRNMYGKETGSDSSTGQDGLGQHSKEGEGANSDNNSQYHDKGRQSNGKDLSK